jgi:hypothetical protein
MKIIPGDADDFFTLLAVTVIDTGTAQVVISSIHTKIPMILFFMFYSSLNRTG